MGLRIFLHSIKLVFGQLGAALRISGLLYIVSAVLSVLGLLFFMPIDASGQPTTFKWQIIPIMLISSVITLWIAVSWHRFILLEEAPGSALPEPRGDRMLAYFGRMLQVGLVTFAVILLVGLAYGIFLAMVPNMVIALAGMVVVIAAALVVTYRLAPALPAAAIGRPIGIGAAWTATSGATGTIVVLAAASAIASIIIDLPIELFRFAPAGALLALVWIHITAWVKLMVGVSILTTLYGVYIEQRSID